MNAEPRGVDLLLDQRGIGLRRVEPIPGREAGAEEDDPAAPAVGGAAADRRRAGRSRVAGRRPTSTASSRPIQPCTGLSLTTMLRCDSLTKTYRSGGRELTVLNNISFRWSRAASWRSWVRPAAERPRCSACSPDWTARPRARCTSTARTSAPSTGTRARGSAARRSASSSSRSSSSPRSPRWRTCRCRWSFAARRPAARAAELLERVGAGRPGPPLSGAALRRRAAAGGARPRLQHPAEGPLRRRADRQSRCAHRRHDHGSHGRAEPGPRHHAGAGHPRSRPGRAGPPHHPAGRRAASSPTAAA